MDPLGKLYDCLQYGSASRAVAAVDSYVRADLRPRYRVKLPMKAMLFALHNTLDVVKHVHQYCAFELETSSVVLEHCLSLGGDPQVLKFLLSRNYRLESGATKLLFECPPATIRLVRGLAAVDDGIKILTATKKIYSCIGRAHSPQSVELLFGPIDGLEQQVAEQLRRKDPCIRNMFMSAGSPALIEWMVELCKYDSFALCCALDSLAASHAFNVSYRESGLFNRLLRAQHSRDFDVGLVETLSARGHHRYLRMVHHRYPGLDALLATA